MEFPEQVRPTGAVSLAVGTVQGNVGPGTMIVALRDDPGQCITCTLLHPVGGHSRTPPIGCPVLTWCDAATATGIVLGALEVPLVEECDETIPEELIIEARGLLTLRVGKGSITIREDGKILIKGKDLVSHAQRMNRIKGGSVSIN